ncbi:MAG: hypothetical protein ACMG6S_00590 [Byssovorax sp.]
MAKKSKKSGSAGNRGKSEQALRAAIARAPSNVEAYITLADFLADVDGDEAAELTAALEVLTDARAKVGDADARWALDEQIAELRERLAALGKDSGTA